MTGWQLGREASRRDDSGDGCRLRLSRRRHKTREISTGLYIPRRLTTWDEADPGRSRAIIVRAVYGTLLHHLVVDHDPGNMRRDDSVFWALKRTPPAPHRVSGVESGHLEDLGGFSDVACAARGEVLVRLPDAGRRTVRVSPVESLSSMGRTTSCFTDAYHRLVEFGKFPLAREATTLKFLHGQSPSSLGKAGDWTASAAEV